ATYASNDDSAIVVIGSGAGGGTLANELCQKGLPVVLLEAGDRQSPTTFHNEEGFAFNQLAWLDKRNTSGTWRGAERLPQSAGVDMQDGGRDDRPLGGSLAAPAGTRIQGQDPLLGNKRGEPARLATHARGPRAVLRQG